MLKFDRKSVIVAIAFGLSVVANGQSLADGPDATIQGELGAKLDEHVRKMVTAHDFAGTVLVARKGDVVLHKGYGLANRKNQTPMQPETALCIGSNTKCFTAAAVLRLVHQGKLKLDTPITKFLKDVPEDKRDITIHQLLSHSSGLGEYHDRPGEGGDFAEMSRQEAVRRILEQPLRCRPGERMEYSNCGYTLLAVIIELASGQTWETFLHEQVFKPAGMSRTGFFGERLWDAAAVATGYGKKKKDTNSPRDWPGVTWALKGAGGIVSTAGDMHKWHQALQGESIVDAKLKAEAFKIHVKAEDGLSGEGYGWIVIRTPRNTTVLNTAGGSEFGFNAVLFRYLEEDAVISVMSNAGIGKAGPVAEAIPRILFNLREPERRD